MRKRFLWLLLAAAGVLGMLVFVLGLPVFMNRVMDRSLYQTHEFALAEQPDMQPAETEQPWQEPLPTAIPYTHVVPQIDVATAFPMPEGWVPAEDVVVSVSGELPWDVPVLVTAMPLVPTFSGAQSVKTEGVQPLAWRDLLMQTDGSVLDGFSLAQGNLAQLGEEAAFDPQQALYYTMPDEQALLIENLQPLTLAKQKLLWGIRQNLSSDPIFVPPEKTIDQVWDLGLKSMILSQKGDLSTLMLSQRSVFPLPVFRRFLEQEGRNTMGSGDYLAIVEQLHADARRLWEGDADISDAVQRSQQLIDGMMWGDKPWQLTIARMEPYVFEPDWEYMVAGHHVLCVDMEGGSLYTLTTDLLSDRVIGIATEEQEPFLKTYAALVEKGRGLFKPADPGDEAAARQYMTHLMERLSGQSFPADKWAMTFGRNYGDGEMEWSLAAMPLDATARMLDPEVRGYLDYALFLGEDLSLIQYNRSHQPIASTSGETYSIHQVDQLIRQAEDVEKVQPGFAAAAAYAADNALAIMQEHLTRLSDSNLQFTLEDDSIRFSVTRNAYSDEPTLGDKPFWTMSIEADVHDETRHRYWMVVEVQEPGNTILASLYQWRNLQE